MLNGTDFIDSRNHIYGLAHTVAKDGREQRALVDALRETEMQMTKAGDNNTEIIITMLGVILDGLKFGNWPWIKNGVNTLYKNNS